MIADSILIVIAFVSGTIGTLWKDPPKIAKVALIFLLVASSFAAIAKAYYDDKDKEFLQQLAVSNLVLPNSVYDKIYSQIANTYSDSEIDACHHTENGMTCLLKPTEGQPPIALVFSRYEIAQVYANILRGRDPTSDLRGSAEKIYDPNQPNDEYEDKLGILGFHTFFRLCGKFPQDYTYDDTSGIKLIYDNGGEQKTIVLTPEEMKTPKEDHATILFGKFSQIFITKIHEALPDCQ
jgi:hypothetical protein